MYKYRQSNTHTHTHIYIYIYNHILQKRILQLQFLSSHPVCYVCNNSFLLSLFLSASIFFLRFYYLKMSFDPFFFLFLVYYAFIWFAFKAQENALSVERASIFSRSFVLEVPWLTPSLLYIISIIVPGIFWCQEFCETVVVAEAKRPNQNWQGKDSCCTPANG